MRCQVVLLAADGLANNAIATALGISRPTVLLWRARFIAHGPQALVEDAPGRGRPRSITADQVKRIVTATTQTTPPAATHWSCRTSRGAGREPRDRAARLGRARTQPHLTRRSSCPATNGSWRSSRMSLACTSIRPRKRWSCALTRRARFRRSIAPSRVAAQEGAGWHDDARLQAARNDNAVRGAQRAGREGHRAMSPATYEPGIRAVPRRNREGVPGDTNAASDSGQLRDAHASEGQGVVGSTSAISACTSPRPAPRG